jgi:ATP-dependent RNA helicase DHX37/DHR1
MMSQALRERAAGIAQSDESILFEPRRKPAEVSTHHDSEMKDDSETESGLLQQTGEVYKPEKISAPEPLTSSIAAGSGLKRPLEVDNEGKPILRKRQKRGGVKSKISRKPGFTPEFIPNPSSDHSDDSSEGGEDDEEDEWNGLSSDESAQSNSRESSENESAGADEDMSDEEASSSEEEDSDDDEGKDPKVRSSAFKAWAHEQRNTALGYESTGNSNAILNIPIPENFKPRPIEQEPLPLELQPTKYTGRKAFSVVVDRTPEIHEGRLKLPVVADEQRIMEAIHNNNTVIICGATGSGKSTQVPQMLFEAGYGSPNSPTPGKIVVTQPRKVAAGE